MIAVPVAMPFIIPVPGPAIATSVLELIHVPSGMESCNTVVASAQTDKVPVMGEVVAFTVSIAVV